MKALCVVVVLLGLTLPVAAQVVDMRALSRRRGYVAYQPKRQARSPQSERTAEKKAAPEEGNAPENAGNGAEETGVENADVSEDRQTREMMEYIRNNPQVQPDI